MPLYASNLFQTQVQMIFPWMFDELAGLRELKEVADILAEKADWGELYREKVLQENKVSTLEVPLIRIIGGLLSEPGSGAFLFIRDLLRIGCVTTGRGSIAFQSYVLTLPNRSAELAWECALSVSIAYGKGGLMEVPPSRDGFKVKHSF